MRTERYRERRSSLPHSPVDSPTVITEITGQLGPLSAVFKIFFKMLFTAGW